MPRATTAALFVALSSLTFAGCSDGGQEGAEGIVTDGESSGVSAPPAADEPGPSEDVKGLKKQLLDANTGSFTSNVFIADAQFRRTGTYSLRQRSSDTTTIVFIEGVKSLSVHSVVVDDITYAQIDNGSGYGDCWLAYPPELVGALNDIAPVGYTVVGVPVEVGVVGATETGSDGTQLTSDLATVVSLVGAKLASALGVSPNDTTRTPITLLADDEGITGWETDLQAVLTSATQAGNEVAPGIEQLLALPGSDGVTLSGSIDNLGISVDIEAPPPELQVEVTRDAAAFEAALSSCEQR